MENNYHYGQWGIVFIMIAIFGWLVFRFLRPKRKIEWRNSGIFGAFLIALYAEMYGFPLTIYILSSVFGVDIPFTRLNGHLWASLFGWGEIGAIIEMLFGYLILMIGVSLIMSGWKKIHQAQDKLVVDGIYSYMRHPQYTGIILIATGMLIHWPTLITIILFPILVFVYYRLAKKEEHEMEKQFGDIYQEYKNRTPMFFPSLYPLLIGKR